MSELPRRSKTGSATDWRFSFFYGAVFLTLGLYLPFWPVYLEARALSAGEIGLVLAAATWSKVLTTPAIGQLADRAVDTRRVTLWVALGGLLAFAAFGWVGGLWPILLLHLLAYGLFYALIPLAEAQTLAASLARALNYGRMRLWGSLAFVLGSLAGGWALERFSPQALPWLLSAALALTALAAACLPATPRAPGKPGMSGLRLLADRRFLAFILGAALLQASHAAYYVFSALHWQAAGISPTLIGWLWTEGVLAEVAVFAAGSWLLARFGALGLLVIGGLAGVLRWGLSALPPELGPLLVLQLLHGLTFGAAHLGAMQILARKAAAAGGAGAQSLYSAASGGLIMGAAALLAGLLYAASPALAFFAMAVLSGLGVVVLLGLRLSAGRAYFVP